MKNHILLYLLFCGTEVCGQIDSVETGIASYYADKFEGMPTASGEIFSNHRISAAHKTLPFGTHLRVTNLRNGKSILVHVNDRLPSYSRRSIDLSKAAAAKLGFIRAGIVEVKIEIVPKDSLPAKIPNQLAKRRR